MTEHRARAAQGDITAINDILWGLVHSVIGQADERVAAEGVTPETVRTWLDAAEAHRPRSSRHDERMFAIPLASTASTLVSLAESTGEPWNQLLSHPVFTSPMITAPERSQLPAPFAPERLEPPGPQYGGQGSLPGAIPHEVFDAAAFAVTVGLVPFLQTIATQTAQRTFDAARATIRKRLRGGDGRVSGPHLVIEERDDRMEFRVPSDIPDAALEALVALGEHGLETLATPDPRGRAVTVSWNTMSRRWERIVHRG